MAAFDSSESMKQAAASMTGAVNSMLAGVGNISVSLNGMGQSFMRMQSAMDRFVESLNASVQRLIGGLGAGQGVPPEAAGLGGPQVVGLASAELDNFAANLSTSTQSLDSLSGAAMDAADSLRQTGEKTGSMFDSISESLKGFDFVLKPLSGLNLKEMTSEEHKAIGGEQRKERERERRKGRFERFGETIQPYTARAGRLGGNLVGGAVGGMAGAVTGSMAGGVGALPGALAGGASGALTGGNIGGFMGSLTGKLGGMVDGIMGAVSSVVSSFMKIVAVVNTFVAAFNPALVQQFMLTIKDLIAVVGAGLQPITTAFTLLARQLADQLVPIIQQMAPYFSKVGEALIRGITPLIGAMTEFYGAMMPLIQEFGPVVAELAGRLGNVAAEIMKALTPIIGIVLELVMPLADLMGGLLDILVPVIQILGTLIGAVGSLVGEIMDYVAPAFRIISNGFTMVADVLQGFADAVSKVIDFIMDKVDMVSHPIDRLLGIETDYQKMQRSKKEASERQKGLTGASIGAAAQQAQYTAVEDLSKNLIKAAFSGSGNDRLNQIANNTGKQVELLEQIAAKGDKNQFPNRAGGDFGKGV